MTMDFGKACWSGQIGNTRRDPWCGKSVRYARRWLIVGSPPNTYLPYSATMEYVLALISPTSAHHNHVAASLEPASTYATSAQHKRSTKRTDGNPIRMRLQPKFEWGRKTQRRVQRCNRKSVALPTLSCSMVEPRICHFPILHLPMSLFILTMFTTAFITSLCCTALSIDTRTTLARFLGRFWSYTRTPHTGWSTAGLLQNPYPAHGYGFSGVRVRVALESLRPQGYPCESLPVAGLHQFFFCLSNLIV